MIVNIDAVSAIIVPLRDRDAGRCSGPPMVSGGFFLMVLASDDLSGIIILGRAGYFRADGHDSNVHTFVLILLRREL